MDYVKNRKALEDQASPILLIGSRAFDGDFAISAKDWDLIIPHSSLVTFIQHHYDQFSWLSVQRGVFPKVVGRLTNGQMVEFELVENYASNKLLYTDKFIVEEWRQYTSNSFGVGQIKLKLATNEALLALKYSTCFFPVNWTKNIRQLVAMKKKMGLNTFFTLLENENVRHLVDLRARETLARCTYNHRIFRKQLVSDDECQTAEYITRAYEQYNTTDPKQQGKGIEFPLTGITINRPKFVLASDEQRKIIVEEQLTLLERYFAAYGPEQAAELALEAFFTQSVPVKWQERLNSLLAKTHCIYTNSLYRTPGFGKQTTDWNDPEFEDVFQAEFMNNEPYTTYLKQELLHYTAPQASDAELQQSTFKNFAIAWAIDHIEEFSNRHVTLPTNFTPVATQVTVPSDVWRVISEHIDDHITLAAFEQVCKAAAHSVNWETLVKSCWTEEDLAAHEEAMSAPHPNWKVIFRAIYTHHVSRKLYACPHCGGNHPVPSKEEWDAFSTQRPIDRDTEAYDGNCMCIFCDVGSWGSCKYYPHFEPGSEMFPDYYAPVPPQQSRCLIQ